MKEIRKKLANMYSNEQKRKKIAAEKRLILSSTILIGL